MKKRVLTILLAEDDPCDIMLTRHALNADTEIHTELHITRNGLETLRFLRAEGEYRNSPRPDLILLDLNMPVLDGRDVLAQIKADQNLRTIPVIILSNSDSSHDILASYDLQANCYFTKPASMDGYRELLQSVHQFWIRVEKLPIDNSIRRNKRHEAV